ncbi:serine hydrolase domain-containing protein [Butyrivibrio fibrisolvens]|jgi:CubicO group peptidase (beta-lactamase class C family)|uniref:serine hydrolase domain-containing protein n=1 Tax=Butyrivibrio fibrisolvens TaxID=831 RepID=UPI0020BD8495|nr:serine hydrolase domain-containing protein [Butyrivibrio fibrisolvens]
MNIRKLTRLDDYMQKRAASIPGATIIIEHNGKRVYENNFGMDRKDSIYRIMSMTKPITALAAMILYERGMLDLMENVSTYIPSFADVKVASVGGFKNPDRQIIVRDLLNMTSGIVLPGDYGQAGQSMSKAYREARVQKRSGILKSNIDITSKFAESVLMFDPGTSVHYGLSADILAAIIEIVSGMKFSDFLTKEIFTPLNMSETDFKIDGDKAFRQAVMMGRPDANGKVTRADASTLQRFEMEAPFDEPWYESGGIGLYSTVEDYEHFCQMLLNKGSFHGKELIGRRTYQFMTSNHLTDDQLREFGRDGYGYGCYYNVLIDPIKAASNGSAGAIEVTGEAGTYFCVDPEEDLIIMYMSQMDGGADPAFIRGIRQIVYGAM